MNVSTNAGFVLHAQRMVGATKYRLGAGHTLAVVLALSPPHETDCSGAVMWSAAQVGLFQPGKPLYGVRPDYTNARALLGLCVGSLSVAEASRRRGALLFKIGGQYDHVAIVIAPGYIVHATGGSVRRVVIEALPAGIAWTHGGWIV